MDMLVQKVQELLDQLPEGTRSIVIKKYSTSTDTSEPEISPKVQKLLTIFESLSDEEKKSFHENAYPDMKMGKCDKGMCGDKGMHDDKEDALAY